MAETDSERNAKAARAHPDAEIEKSTYTVNVYDKFAGMLADPSGKTQITVEQARHALDNAGMGRSAEVWTSDSLHAHRVDKQDLQAIIARANASTYEKQHPVADKKPEGYQTVDEGRRQTPAELAAREAEEKKKRDLEAKTSAPKADAPKAAAAHAAADRPKTVGHAAAKAADTPAADKTGPDTPASRDTSVDVLGGSVLALIQLIAPLFQGPDGHSIFDGLLQKMDAARNGAQAPEAAADNTASKRSAGLPQPGGRG